MALICFSCTLVSSLTTSMRTSWTWPGAASTTLSYPSSVRIAFVYRPPLDAFVAGDDADAKAAVSGFVDSAGLRPIDVGDLPQARWLEVSASSAWVSRWSAAPTSPAG